MEENENRENLQQEDAVKTDEVIEETAVNSEQLEEPKDVSGDVGGFPENPDFNGPPSEPPQAQSKFSKFIGQKFGLVTIILSIVCVILLMTSVVMFVRYSDLSRDLSKMTNAYNHLENSTKDWVELTDEEKARLLSVLDIDAEINGLNEQKTALEGEISALTNTKAGLEADIIRLRGEPKSFPAGYLTAGTDFDIGRYKIYNGSSNFVVYSSGGDLRVNIILGGSYGVDEYIYSFKQGDQIKASSSFTMVPIE